MSYKRRAIKAFKKLAYKYRHPQGENFFNSKTCPLCHVYPGVNSCRGCPLADIEGNSGCMDFRTFVEAKRAIDGIISNTGHESYIYPKDKPTIPEFIARAEFFEKYLPIIKKLPSKIFTPSRWRYFKELDRND